MFYEAEESIVDSIPAESFHYDKDDKKFVVGDNTFDISDFETQLAAFYASSDKTGTISKDSALWLTQFGLFGTPKLYRALQSIEDLSQMRQDIVDTMVDAFEATSGSDLPALMRDPQGHLGFDIGLIRPGHPAVNVLGDCACLSVSVNPFILSDADMQFGYMEFTEHNVHQNTQRVSLYAGIGRLAALLSAS